MDTETTVGIDCITCIIDDVIVKSEVKYPEHAEQPLLRVEPTTDGTKISLILPRFVRESNAIGFGILDVVHLLDVTNNVNKALNELFNCDLSKLKVKQVEVAGTIVFPALVNINKLMEFLHSVLLPLEQKTKHDKTRLSKDCSAMVTYSTGMRKKGCTTLKNEVYKSFSFADSNKRIVWKIYNRGNGSTYGGENNVLRIESRYLLRGVRHVLKKNNKTIDIMLDEVLTAETISKFLRQYRQDFAVSICPQIRNGLDDAVNILYEKLKTGTKPSDILKEREYVFDWRIVKKALRLFYKYENKTTRQADRLISYYYKQAREEQVPEGVIEVLEIMSKSVKAVT